MIKYERRKVLSNQSIIFNGVIGGRRNDSNIYSDHPDNDVVTVW